MKIASTISGGAGYAARWVRHERVLDGAAFAQALQIPPDIGIYSMPMSGKASREVGHLDLRVERLPRGPLWR